MNATELAAFDTKGCHNLEAMTDEDLSVVQSYHKNTIYVDIAVMLGYARRARKIGEIQRAHAYERQIDRLYALLPENLRW